MALNKTVEQPSGAAVTYWRVTEAIANWANKTLLVRVGGYVDEESRREGKTPLTVWQNQYRGDGFPLTVEGKNVAEVYAAIKQDPFFAGATDV